VLMINYLKSIRGKIIIHYITFIRNFFNKKVNNSYTRLLLGHIFEIARKKVVFQVNCY